MLLLLLPFLLLAGCKAEACAYDYSASIECLENPLGAQYSGGILENAEFDGGLEGWNVMGTGIIEVRKSNTGNNFIVSHSRTLPNDSFSQTLFLQKDTHYIFSAWVQVTQGEEEVIVIHNSPGRAADVVGSTVPHIGCWSMIKGGITVDNDTQTQLYFQTNNTNTELWVDSVSVQSFTRSQWRQQQQESIEKLRRGNLNLHVVDKNGVNLQGSNVTLQHKKPHFPIGGGIALTIIDNKDYQKYFASRFTTMTFDNEMKWDYVEKTDGHEKYKIPDAMFAYAEEHGIKVRGHNIFWAHDKYNLEWVKPMQGRELIQKSVRRIGSVMARYTGRIIGWDVMNENLHFHFFEERIGPNASAMFYKIAQALDPNTTMFLNEYSTLEYPSDMDVIPSKYVRMFHKIRSYPGNEKMVIGIGLQGHFNKPIIPYIRACLDIFDTLKMPIWITELTVDQKEPRQAEYLEEVMREVYSHSGVEGIIVWGGWKPTGCREMCLTDNNFKNLPAGDVLDKLLAEWKTDRLEGATDENGEFAARIFKGTYSLTVKNPASGETLEKVLEVTSENNDVSISFF